MKKYKLLLSLFSVIAICSSFCIRSEWYFFETDQVSIEFPVKPVPGSNMVSSDLGKLKVETAFYEPGEADKNVFLYGLLTSAYPDSVINSDKKELLFMFFRNSIDGTVKDIHGKLLSEKTITSGIYPGREVRIDYGNGKAIINMRLYLIKNKMTILQVITPVAVADSSNKTRFLNSFKIK